MGKSKFILGSIIAGQDRLIISLITPREGECLKIARVIDVNDPSVISATGNNGITAVGYQGKNSFSKTKTLRIIFENGEEETITTFVPAKNQQFNLSDLSGAAKVSGRDEKYAYNAFGNGVTQKFNEEVSQALFPQSDPSNKFGFDGIYKERSPIAISSESPIGTVDPRPEVQFVQIASVLGGSYLKAKELWLDVLNEVEIPVSIAFLWSKDLPKEDFKIDTLFEVCKAEGHANYYKNTGLDCGGNVIPVDNLSGAIPSIFKEGCDCVTNYLQFNARAYAEDAEINALGSIKIQISSVPESPYNNPLGSKDAYVQDKEPVYPALNTYTYQYSITPPKGMGPSVFSGVTNDSSWTFNNLVPGPGIYVLTAENIDSGITSTLTSVVANKGSRDTLNKGDWATCGNAGALNFVVSAAECNDCCVTCKDNGQLYVGQTPGPNAVIDGGSSVVPTTTIGGVDGTINFLGQPNGSLDPEVFNGATYDVTLYNTTAFGAAFGAVVDAQVAIAAPTYSWNTLPTGWYAVQVLLTGEYCTSTYYYFVGEPEAVPVDCSGTSGLSTSIDPCTGQVGTSAFSALGNGFNLSYLLNGLSVSPPIFVAEGDTLLTTMVFQDGVLCLPIEDLVQVTADMLICEEEEPPIIEGCMDPNGLNYNPKANTPTACTYPVFGCMDPGATNYNPLATDPGGEPCTYAIVGCMDPTAINFDPLATIPDTPSCVYPCTLAIIDTITLAGLIPTIVFLNVPTTYEVSWVNLEAGTVTVTNDTPIGPTLVTDTIYQVTIVTGAGCIESYILGVDTSPVFGCMDINATNYVSSANAPFEFATENGTSGTTIGGVCQYDLNILPCRPSDIDVVMGETNLCLSTMGQTYYSLLRTGRLSECKTKDFKIVHLIQYLLSQAGLECIYNCTDSITPNLNTLSCMERWIQGGPTGGSLAYDNTITYQWGDLITYKDTGYYYINIESVGNVPGTQPHTTSGNDVWQICIDPVLPTDTTNRLDTYLAYLKDACRDCGLPGVPGIENTSTKSGSGSLASSEGDTLEMGGDKIDF